MKGKKIILGILVVVLFIAALGLCFYAGTKVGKKQETKVEEKEKEQEKTSEEEAKKEDKDEKEESTDKEVVLKKNDKLVSDALGVMPRYMCGGVFYRFDGKSRTVDKFTNDEKIYMLFGAVSDKIFEASSKEDFDAEKDYITFEEKEFKKYFSDLSFLSEIKKDKEGYGLDYPPAVVKYNNGKYEAHSYPTGCIGGGEDGDYLYFEKATKKGNELTVRYIHTYVVIDFNEKDDDFVRTYYKAKGDKKAVDVDFEYADGEDKIVGDASSLDRYDFVFDISDGNMRIKAINYIKP